MLQIFAISVTFLPLENSNSAIAGKKGGEKMMKRVFSISCNFSRGFVRRNPNFRIDLIRSFSQRLGDLPSSNFHF